MLTTFREKAETECNRRTSQIEAQFQADCQKVTERYEHACGVWKCTTANSWRSSWTNNVRRGPSGSLRRDELTQECAEAQGNKGSSPEREKTTSSDGPHPGERDAGEKTYKEHLNSMVVEREQLLRDLEDLRNVSESQQSPVQPDTWAEEAVMKRAEGPWAGPVPGRAPQSSWSAQRLEQLQREHDQERQEMMSKLLVMESIHRATCEKADREGWDEHRNLRLRIKSRRWSRWCLLPPGFRIAVRW